MFLPSRMNAEHREEPLTPPAKEFKKFIKCHSSHASPTFPPRQLRRLTARGAVDLYPKGVSASCDSI
ncbi:hypothetical protein E2C01_024735 [Portunus trituberculatus]|uniref:Uncharacterized protein n=1 Tax=Portunus trituberculatus TaxID=210409 RepID=A0A5B7EDZ9_PORTR|nr:hypothetical protein [Portunus trituberculatus]